MFHDNEVRILLTALTNATTNATHYVFKSKMSQHKVDDNELPAS